MKPEPMDYDSDRKRVIAGIREHYGIDLFESEFDELNRAAKDSDPFESCETIRGRIEYRLVHLHTPDGRSVAIPIGWAKRDGRACLVGHKRKAAP